MDYIVRIGRPEDAEGYRYAQADAPYSVGHNRAEATGFRTYESALEESKLYTFGHVWVKREEDEHKVVSDTTYDWRTPDALISLLEKLRMLRARCVFVYGNPETCVPWEEDIPNRGRIGRSTGTQQIPLLIKTRRSMGGEALLTHCILAVKESVGGKIIYDRRKK